MSCRVCRSTSKGVDATISKIRRPRRRSRAAPTAKTHRLPLSGKVPLHCHMICRTGDYAAKSKVLTDLRGGICQNLGDKASALSLWVPTPWLADPDSVRQYLAAGSRGIWSVADQHEEMQCTVNNSPGMLFRLRTTLILRPSGIPTWRQCRIRTKRSERWNRHNPGSELLRFQQAGSLWSRDFTGNWSSRPIQTISHSGVL